MFTPLNFENHRAIRILIITPFKPWKHLILPFSKLKAWASLGGEVFEKVVENLHLGAVLHILYRAHRLEIKINRNHTTTALLTIGPSNIQATGNKN